jgi:hypothetical protein
MVDFHSALPKLLKPGGIYSFFSEWLSSWCEKGSRRPAIDDYTVDMAAGRQHVQLGQDTGGEVCDAGLGKGYAISTTVLFLWPTAYPHADGLAPDNTFFHLVYNRLVQVSIEEHICVLEQ